MMDEAGFGDFTLARVTMQELSFFIVLTSMVVSGPVQADGPIRRIDQW
jgi:hypothetical protein